MEGKTASFIGVQRNLPLREDIRISSVFAIIAIMIIIVLKIIKTFLFITILLLLKKSFFCLCNAPFIPFYPRFANPIQMYPIYWVNCCKWKRLFFPLNSLTDVDTRRWILSYIQKNRWYLGPIKFMWKSNVTKHTISLHLTITKEAGDHLTRKTKLTFFCNGWKEKTSQELRMLSTVTIAMIVMNSGSHKSSTVKKGHKPCLCHIFIRPRYQWSDIWVGVTVT